MVQPLSAMSAGKNVENSQSAERRRLGTDKKLGGGGGCVGQVGATKRPCCPSETQLCLLQLDSGVPGGPHNKFMLICPNVVRFLVFAINLIAKYDSAREAT